MRISVNPRGELFRAVFSRSLIIMRDDQYRFLEISGQVPARLSAEQVSWILNCQPHDIPVLVVAKLLKPLGAPVPNAVKYFAAVEIMELAKDRAWLAKATNAVAQYWKRKNLNKKGRSPAEGNGPATEISLVA